MRSERKMNYRNLCSFCIALFAVYMMAGLVQAEIIAHYSFDIDFTDASGNANNLVIANLTPTVTTTEGEYVFGGGALDIDSTTGNKEYLDLTNPITFTETEAWSIAFWARRRPGTSDKSGMVIGDPSNTTDFIWLSNNPTQVQGLRFRSSSNKNANFGVFPDDNLFHHWAVVADGAGNVTSYRDNVPQASVAIASAFSIASVAHAYSANTQSMDGQIDELYIFDEAIDATAVDKLYDNTFFGLDLDLNGDGTYNDQDLNLLLSNFDADDDTGVGAPYSQADLEALLVVFGTDVPGDESASAVPEPTSMALVLFGVIGLLAVRRRK